MATQPKLTDRFVRVAAYMTDETFGYDHWRAAQFSAPAVSSKRPAVLIICQSEDEQKEALAFLQAREKATSVVAVDPVL